MTRLRWTGPQARTFMNHGVGEVEPGRTFPVPDDAADSFLAHEHVELADAPVEQSQPPTGSPPPGDSAAPAKTRRPKASVEPTGDAAAAPAEPSA